MNNLEEKEYIPEYNPNKYKKHSKFAKQAKFANKVWVTSAGVNLVSNSKGKK